MSNIKSKIRDVTLSVNVDKRQPEKWGSILKNISSTTSTANNKVSCTKQNLNDINDNYSVAKSKEISSTF